MIIRENSMRNGKAESLPHLIEYLETGRDKLKPDERVLYKWTVNCEENDPVLAQSEIAAIASMNTRSKAQKYAHIVISPAPGETLTKDEWQECAKALVRKLDMTKHQYLCYVHKDTDQQHLHVIINLIDPETHARNSMPWSKRKEQELAQELEQKFSLRQLDHSAKHSKEETIARDIERKTGQQTLFSYISEFKDELKTAQTWQEFHQILAEHGIKAVYIKGRGLRFEAQTDDEPISQKASAIDRGFSYAKLEKRFGEWQEPEVNTSTQPSESYEAKPVDYEVKQSDREKLKILFDEFRDLQYRRRSERKRLLKAESEHSKLIRDQMRALKKEAEAAARSAHPGDYKAQQAALNEVRLKWKLESAKQRATARKRKAEILRQTKTTTFQEYLRNLRDPINADPARDILSSREGAFETQEINGVMGLEILLKITVTETGFFSLAKRTGKGQDIFTSAMSRGDMIRDLGTRILCNDKPSLLTVFSLLELGKKRYGDQVPLRVFGTAEFQRQAAIAASEAGIKIQCDDPKAQKFFDDLTEDRYDREQRLERLRELGRGSAGDGDFTDSIFTGRAISAAASITTIGTLRVGRRNVGGHALRSRGAGKPDTGRPGKVQRSSSAGGKRGVPKMQRRDLDQNRKQRSVFLYSDASQGMGEHRLDELHADLRREVPRRETGSGRGGAQEPGVSSALDAAMAYVKERNAKRASGMTDIQEHQLWQGQDGQFIFRGYRHLELEEQNFLLLEKDGKIYIKLSSLYEKERLRKYGRGAKVNVSKNGLVSLPRKKHQHTTERNEQSRGRSR